MQISQQQVSYIQGSLQRARRKRPAAPVESVEDLATRHSLRIEEVRRVTTSVLMAEDEPQRARRVQELEQRIARGQYQVDSADLVDMAERRAIADRAG